MNNKKKYVSPDIEVLMLLLQNDLLANSAEWRMNTLTDDFTEIESGSGDDSEISFF